MEETQTQYMYNRFFGVFHMNEINESEISRGGIIYPMLSHFIVVVIVFLNPLFYQFHKIGPSILKLIILPSYFEIYCTFAPTPISPPKNKIYYFSRKQNI
jgi:hypothetical protein